MSPCRELTLKKESAHPEKYHIAICSKRLASRQPQRKRKVPCHFIRSRVNYKLRCCYKARLLYTWYHYALTPPG